MSRITRKFQGTTIGLDTIDKILVVEVHYGKRKARPAADPTSNPIQSMTTPGVREEGDLTKAPFLPHALGKYALADSPLPPGYIPPNVTQKDFIRQVGGFKAAEASTLYVKLKKRSPGNRVFDKQTFADELLANEVRRLKVSAGEAGEAGQILDLAMQTVSGPREHPTYILESEAVRQNIGLQAADSIVRALATLPTAPDAHPAEAEHHFLFGGSKKQKRRLDRKIRNAQRAVEANVAVRKENLVSDNLQVLQGMYASQAQRLAMQAAGGDCEGIVPDPDTQGAGSGSPMASAAAAGASCRSCSGGGIRGNSSTSASATGQSSTSTSIATAVAASVAGIALVLGIALILGTRRSSSGGPQLRKKKK
jgi:hypothetical protein